MKIKDIAFEKLVIPMNCEFRIAFGVISSSTSVIVKIVADNGLVGYGEAAPFPCVTGESCQTVLHALALFRKALVGMDAMNIEGIHAAMDGMLIHNASAKCAVDIALYDLCGKRSEQPLYKILGGYSRTAQNDVTIGIDSAERMVEKAREHVRMGYRILKVKGGLDVKKDVEVIAMIREAVGPDIRLRVDANQGYTVADGVYAAGHMARCGVEALEQCLKAWDIDGHAAIRRQANGVRIMLDESVHGPEDAMRIARSFAADMLNIKLMKCGGLYPAMRINAVAEAAGMSCMVGCMMETKIAITAGLSLVAAKKNITDADCDSFMFAKDPEMGMPGGYTMDKDMFTLSEEPGLGLSVNF